ncbi:MAG TPA: threonine synthase [Bacteroidales bacterium]|nr:threonine synthase [Bacteroidales bacterium]
MNPNKFLYKCTDCGREYSTGETIYLCPACCITNRATNPPSGVLKILYDYSDLRKKDYRFDDLKKSGFADLLPIASLDSYPSLRVGNTPLYTMNTVDGERVPFRLHLKDDSQNPTYSFKDRASALVSAYAVEHDLGTIVTASTGNAGSSLAGICASKGQKAVIMVPETAPLAKLTQIIMYGATLVPVKGTYDDAFDLSIRASEEFGWYNRNTAYNPLTIEGKKTVSFELFDQLQFKVPDRIFVPVGDGVIISGIYKGFEDLMQLNLIDRMPVIIAVQSEKSDNLVRNIGMKEFSVIPSSTIADSISVDIPRNFFMTRGYMQQYGGEAITVSDEEITRASSVLSASTGLFAEPAAAAAFAGLLSYLRDNRITENSDNVVMLTGSGLKDLKSVASIIRMPESIPPSIEELKRLLA